MALRGGLFGTRVGWAWLAVAIMAGVVVLVATRDGMAACGGATHECIAPAVAGARSPKEDVGVRLALLRTHTARAAQMRSLRLDGKEIYRLIVPLWPSGDGSGDIR